MSGAVGICHECGKRYGEGKPSGAHTRWAGLCFWCGNEFSIHQGGVTSPRHYGYPQSIDRDKDETMCMSERMSDEEFDLGDGVELEELLAELLALAQGHDSPNNPDELAAEIGRRLRAERNARRDAELVIERLVDCDKCRESWLYNDALECSHGYECKSQDCIAALIAAEKEADDA